MHGVVVDQILADENATGQVSWVLTDNQGSVQDVVDSTGNVTNHITYDSFGRITNQSNPTASIRFGYTGRELDTETGLNYYRARYYDSANGQFINQDPIGFSGGDVNLYRYVVNSPTNYIDPTGNFAFALPFSGGALAELGAIVAGVAAIATAPVSAPVAAVAIVGSAVVGGAIGLYLNRNQQTNLDTTPIPGLNPNHIPERNTPKPRFDPNDINYGKTPDFLPDPLVGGGFKLGDRFDPNEININHGVPLKLPNTLTFPRGENCLFPPFFASGAIIGPKPVYSAPTNPLTGPFITMDQAVDLATKHVGGNGKIGVSGSGGFQYVVNTVDAAGNPIRKIARFDINPSSPHVQEYGPHLNLEVQNANGKTIRSGPMADPHLPIDPGTIQLTDIP